MTYDYGPTVEIRDMPTRVILLPHSFNIHDRVKDFNLFFWNNDPQTQSTNSNIIMKS